MAVKYNLVAKNGEYKDKNGDTKTRWTKIGVVMETKNGGLAAKFEMLPLEWDGWAQLADPTPREAQEGGKANGYQPQTLDDLEDSVPF